MISAVGREHKRLNKMILVLGSGCGSIGRATTLPI